MTKHYYLRFLWCLCLLTASTLSPIFAQNNSVVWSRTIESFSQNVLISTASDGSVGVIQNSVLGGSSNTFTKFNADGSIAWTRSVSQLGLRSTSNSPEQLLRIARTVDGGFVIIGRYGYTLRGATILQNVIVKVDGNGTLIWSRNLMCCDLNYTNIVGTTEGGFLVGYNTDNNFGRVAAFLTKIDSDGQIVWDKELSAFQSVYSISSTGGAYALVGVAMPTTSSQQPTGLFCRLDKDGLGLLYKYFILEDRLYQVKYDQLDQTFLVATITKDSQYSLLKLNTSGDVLFRTIIGNQTDPPSINIAPNPQEGYLLASTEANNIRLSRISRSGTVQSFQTFGGSNIDFFRSFDIQPNGNIVIAGITQSTDGDLVNRQVPSSAPVAWVFSLSTSGTTPPVTPPVTPPSGFALTTPAYDCTTGQLTVNTTSSNGAAVEYRIVGNRDWSSSNVFAIPAHQRQGTTFTLDARIVGGNTISAPFTSACGTIPPVTPPVTPPTGTALSFGGSSLICDTGQLTINTLGGDGTTIEFKVPGLADWQRSNTFQIPIYQRNGTTFTLYIRQSGREVQTSYTPGCAVSRVAISAEAGTGLNAVVLPNPIVGNELVVEVTGTAGQAVDFSLTDVGGRVLTTQRATVATDRHRQTLAVGQLIEGYYLLRVSTTSQTKTVKVLKR